MSFFLVTNYFFIIVFKIADIDKGLLENVHPLNHEDYSNENEVIPLVMFCRYVIKDSIEKGNQIFDSYFTKQQLNTKVTVSSKFSFLSRGLFYLELICILIMIGSN